MRANISAINLYQRCPQKWYNRYVLLREPPSNSVALRAGTIFHQGMQLYLEGRKSGADHPVARTSASEFLKSKMWEAFDSGDKKLGSEVGAIMENFAFYEGPKYYDPARIVMVEQDLELPIGDGIILVGRPDAVVYGYDGKLHHLQHKAMMLSLSLSAFKESMRLSPHELGYKRMIERAFPSERYGGSISNILKKGGNPGPEKLDEDVIPIREEDCNDFINRARLKALEMREVMAKVILDHERPERNGDACFSNNSLCVYQKVCLGKIGLDGPPFMDVPEAYPKKGL